MTKIVYFVILAENFYCVYIMNDLLVLWFGVISAFCVVILLINFCLTAMFSGYVYLSDNTLQKDFDNYPTRIIPNEYKSGGTRVWGMVYKVSLWGFSIVSEPIWVESYYWTRSFFLKTPIRWKKMSFLQSLYFRCCQKRYFKIWKEETNLTVYSTTISWRKYSQIQGHVLPLAVEYEDQVISHQLRNVKSIAIYIKKNLAISTLPHKPAGYHNINRQDGEYLADVCYEFNYTLQKLNLPMIWHKCVALGDGTCLFEYGIMDMEKHDWLLEDRSISFIQLYAKIV